MLLLFTNLYISMFTGRWENATWSTVVARLKPIINILGEFLTSIFNNVDTPMTNLGDILNVNGPDASITMVIAFILATITSIGIVVMAVKGIKRVFGIFFAPIR